MTTPHLPDPALAEAARAALRQLDRFERGLLDVTFEGKIPGIDIIAKADGRGAITSLSIAAALIPSSGGVPQAALLPVWTTAALNIALAQAKIYANHELNQNLPALPGAPGGHPGSISGPASAFLSEVYTGTAADGQVEVSVHWSWIVTGMNIAGSFYASTDRLALPERIKEAANIALAKARDDLDCAAAKLAELLAKSQSR
jgi:DNA-binding protein YbaB